jgi:hypothetical protein
VIQVSRTLTIAVSYDDEAPAKPTESTQAPIESKQAVVPAPEVTPSVNIQQNAPAQAAEANGMQDHQGESEMQPDMELVNNGHSDSFGQHAVDDDGYGPIGIKEDG